MTTEIKKKVAYDLDGTQLTRQVLLPEQGPLVVIGTLIDGIATLLPEWENFQNTVKRMLNEKGVPATFAKVERPAPVADEPAIVAPVVAPVVFGDPLAGLTIEQRKAVNYLRSKEGLSIMEVEGNPPPRPRETSGAGDKTPEVVAWYLRYHPKQFAEKYGVIGLGSIEKTGWEIDESTKKKVRKRVRETGHVIARRATIYTVTSTNIEDIEGGAL